MNWAPVRLEDNFWELVLTMGSKDSTHSGFLSHPDGLFYVTVICMQMPVVFNERDSEQKSCSVFPVFSFLMFSSLKS